MEGRFNGGFFALPVWGAYIWSGLFSEFYGILESYLATFKQIQSDIYIKIVYLTAFAKTWLQKSLSHTL